MKTLSRSIVFLVVLILTGCGGALKSRKAAEQSIAGFHKMYNDGKLVNIYAGSHSKLKSATKENDFLDFVGAVQRKLGKETQTVNAGFTVRTFNFTTAVILTQRTSFERGTGTETFTFEIDGEKALLLGYNINSMDLILK